MDEGKAFGRALADRAAELGLDVLGGGISGGLMAGAGAAVGGILGGGELAVENVYNSSHFRSGASTSGFSQAVLPDIHADFTDADIAPLVRLAREMDAGRFAKSDRHSLVNHTERLYTENTNYREGIENGKTQHEGTQIRGESEERYDRMAYPWGLRDFSAGRGESRSWRETARRGAENRGTAVPAGARENVSAKSLGIPGGTDRASMRVVPEHSYTNEMRDLRAEHARNGYHVHYFAGEIEAERDGMTVRARALFDPYRNTLWLNTDDPNVTVHQLGKHERFHMLASADPKLTERIRREIARNNGERQLQRLAEAYTDAYGWENRSADQVMEEILADAYAGIDIFHTRGTNAGAVRFSDATRENVQEAGPVRVNSETVQFSAKYAYPKLSDPEWNLLHRTLARELESGQQFLDASTKWLFAEEKGTCIFSIYGIGDGTDATPLYAVGGRKARTEYIALQAHLKGDKNGTNRTRTTLDRLLEAIESKSGNASNLVSDSANKTRTN